VQVKCSIRPAPNSNGYIDSSASPGGFNPHALNSGKGRSLNPKHSGSLSAAVSAHFEHSLRMEIFESSKRNVKALDRRLANFRRT